MYLSFHNKNHNADLHCVCALPAKLQTDNLHLVFSFWKFTAAVTCETILYRTDQTVKRGFSDLGLSYVSCFFCPPYVVAAAAVVGLVLLLFFFLSALVHLQAKSLHVSHKRVNHENSA